MGDSSRQTIPIRFHKVVFCFLIPLRFITGTINLLNTGSDLAAFFYIIALVLLAATFVGFFSWAKYSWYTLHIYAWYELLMVVPCFFLSLLILKL